MEHEETAEQQALPDAEPAMPVEDPAVSALHAGYHARLVAQGLRVEALKAGMVDLDGLKLLDMSSVTLNADDTVADGMRIMQALKKDKPWLFRSASSSSAAAVPSARPPRMKSAMEMTDDEYAAARRALTRF
jgi:hypothetical protein